MAAYEKIHKVNTTQTMNLILKRMTSGLKPENITQVFVVGGYSYFMSQEFPGISCKLGLLGRPRIIPVK